MKFFFTIIVMMLSAHSVDAQTFSTGKRVITFSDNTRGNRAVPTDIYYPANTAGNNVALATGTVKFPVVVFGHGFVIGTSSYQWLADSLVKYGYIVALPSTEGSLAPSHGNFGEDLAFLCNRITSLNDSTASFLYQRVIKKAAVGGHSMGGGSSFLAAAGIKPSIYALFNFAAAETNPSATQAALLNEKPSLIFSGSSDCIVLPIVQEAMYDNIPFACKTYINIAGGLHCHFANNNAICSFGQVSSGCNTSSVTATSLFTKTISLLLPFLDYYLKDNCTRGEVFVATYNAITGVTKRQSCQSIPSCGPVPVTVEYFRGYKNGSSHNLTWKVNCISSPRASMNLQRSTDGRNFTSIYSLTAEAVRCLQPFDNTDAHPMAGLNYYRLKLTDADGKVSYSNIITLLNKNSSFDITGILPNPVPENGAVVLNVNSSQKNKLQILVTDVSGRQILKQTTEIIAGNNQIPLNLDKLAAGSYQIKAGIDDGDFRIISFVKK